MGTVSQLFQIQYDGAQNYKVDTKASEYHSTTQLSHAFKMLDLVGSFSLVTRVEIWIALKKKKKTNTDFLKEFGDIISVTSRAH